MDIDQFPEDIRPFLLPEPKGRMVYECLGCKCEFGIGRLLYTCPDCGGILLLRDKNTQYTKSVEGRTWRKLFDYRKMLNHKAVKGIFRYYEFIAPIIPLDKILYLGEGHTPLVEANSVLRDEAGARFYFKNDGLNPSASFKDRGMACALSYLNYLIDKKKLTEVLAICASTGDTSAAAALYAAYLGQPVKSAVLLPRGKVTPQQLSQPLGSGAKVLEIPGVFDDCMKVVESLAENYHVALLNSKNSWRILGQESYSFEIAQDFDYEIRNKTVVLPIGNAGNITAVMSGFLKFYRAGIIDGLPKIIGVQSEHADPVYRYYLEEDVSRRKFVPVTVSPSVAQAAMIGNPVSMPRVIALAQEYNRLGGEKRVHVVQVSEQEIMDSMITANRNGHIACTQGGESFAGFKKALHSGLVGKQDVGILDSTAHVLKFTTFQEMYFNDQFDPEFGVTPRQELKNAPIQVLPRTRIKLPGAKRPLSEDEMKTFVQEMASEIAGLLGLKTRIKNPFKLTMLTISIIVVDRTRSDFLRQGESFYLERVKKYARVTWAEVKGRQIKKGSPTRGILEKEGREILKKISDRNHIIALDRLGKTYDSEALAERITRLSMHTSQIAFIIGGPLGLSEEVLNHAHERLSLSPLTFTHEMCRILLLEQVYRAFTIINHEKYHK